MREDGQRQDHRADARRRAAAGRTRSPVKVWAKPAEDLQHRPDAGPRAGRRCRPSRAGPPLRTTQTAARRSSWGAISRPSERRRSPEPSEAVARVDARASAPTAAAGRTPTPWRETPPAPPARRRRAGPARARAASRGRSTVARRSVVAENQSAAARFCGARNIRTPGARRDGEWPPERAQQSSDQAAPRAACSASAASANGQTLPAPGEQPPDEHPERSVVLAAVQVPDERQERIADVAGERQEEVIVAEEGRRDEERHGRDEPDAPPARARRDPRSRVTARGARSLRRGEGRPGC